MIYNTKEEVQGRIAEVQARVTAYNTFLEILINKLEKVKTDQPVTFRPEAAINEASTKQEKINHLEESIKNHQDAIEYEQAQLADLTTQLQKFSAD